MSRVRYSLLCLLVAGLPGCDADTKEFLAPTDAAQPLRVGVKQPKRQDDSGLSQSSGHIWHFHDRQVTVISGGIRGIRLISVSFQSALWIFVFVALFHLMVTVRIYSMVVGMTPCR